jgi:hypothetical protein
MERIESKKASLKKPYHCCSVKKKVSVYAIFCFLLFACRNKFFTFTAGTVQSDQKNPPIVFRNFNLTLPVNDN